MASDPGPACAQEHSSSVQTLQGHNLGQNHGEHEVFLSYNRKQEVFVHDLFDHFLKYPRFQCDNEPFYDAASLPKAEEWRHRLMKAARKCKVAVMILTKDYLTSPWTMMELLHFIDARKADNCDIKLLPVFYGDLSPSDLGDKFREKVDGEVKETEWKELWKTIINKGPASKLGGISLTVESCKEAVQILKNDVNGMVEPFEKMESFIQLQERIVSNVLKHLPSAFLPELDPEVEGCRRLCDLISGKFTEYGRGRQRLGLYGMGGSGKTTICQALCRYFGPSFNYRTYYLEIGSNDSKSKENLREHHRQIVRNLTNLSREQINDIKDLRKLVRISLGKIPVFLAVDDVREDMDSWEEVRAYMSCLCSGSKVIITARSQNILRGLVNEIHCECIPNLNEGEALSLFLKTAAPERTLASLDANEESILRACLQICFFALEEGANTESQVPTEVGHYHPLALRAVAFYFKEQYSKLDSIVQCGEELLKMKKLPYSCDASARLFDVLGIGFDNLCHMGKQLFIDVALYAPRPDDVEDEDIFKWLLDIHADLSSKLIFVKLENLRKMAFLNYEDDERRSSCININMHDLYREYAKKLVNKHDNEDSFRYGVYYDDWYQAPPALASSGWRKAPRIGLHSWKGHVEEVKEWCSVSVIHLVECETIITFSIGCELINLRELRISGCSNLAELNWTQPGSVKLCVVELSSNRSLEILPDFSNRSELRELAVTECSSSVKPINVHSCPRLESLLIVGKNAPEVQSLELCLKLESVQLAWKTPHDGLRVSHLSSLLELMIAGSSVLPTDQSLHEFMAPHGHDLFRQQYPKEMIRYKLTGISELTNLVILHLNYIPLGCLPKELGRIWSSLEHLNLRGCLLNEVVDFSEFLNLQYLSIAQTNVRELLGLGDLKTLVRLDCRFNFRLQKIPDLRPCARLKLVSLEQCPELRAIPRLPPTCYENSSGSEDEHRLKLACNAFMKTTKSVIPPPLFAVHYDRSLAPSTTSEKLNTEVIIMYPHQSLSRKLPNPMPHATVACDGCTMYPLIGPRYKVRDIRLTYDFCSKCLTNKCRRDCNFTDNSSTSISGEYCIEANYDLCYACFEESDCDERDFYEIKQTV